MQTAYRNAKAFAEDLSERLVCMEMDDFFNEVNSKFYKIDTTFMNYFLSIIVNDGEFVVNHDKLRKYGIMTSNKSNHVKEKLYNLRMVEGEDYKTEIIKTKLKQGGFSNKKVYLLTPDSFKICLMRAQHREGQEIDPVKYCKYYLLFEKIHLLYMTYRKFYNAKLLAIKDSKIDDLIVEVKDLKNLNQEQSKEIKELLGYSKDANKKLTEASTELVEVKKKVVETSTELVEVKGIVKSTFNIAMSIKSSFDGFVSFVKSNLNNCMQTTKAETTKDYISEISINGAFRKMKIQYVVLARYRGVTKVYPRCTNIDGIYQSLKSIGGKLEVYAISINICEINQQFSRFKMIDPRLSSRKPFEYNGDIENLVEPMKRTHKTNHPNRNEITEYIISQDSEFEQNILDGLQTILEMHISRYGYASRPSKRDVDAKLLEVVQYARSEFNNDAKLEELIRNNGEERIKDHLDRITYISE